MSRPIRALAKANELTDVRAIAIVMLFLSHSNLELSAPVLAEQITQWFLSAFFFVAGYLTNISFDKKEKRVKDFLAHRFATTYLPYILIMGFYVLADNIVHYSPAGFLAQASFLSVFNAFSVGQYYMTEFWFISLLLFFTALFVLLDKFVKNDVWRLAFLLALFFFNLVNYAFMTSFRFEYNFGFYLLVFAIGYEVSRKSLLEKLKKPRIIIAFAFVALPIAYLNLFVPIMWDTATVVGRFYYYAYLWIDNTIFSVSSLVLLLSLLFYLRRKFEKNKVYVLVGVLGTCSLYIYLWEGFLATRISLLLFGTTQYYQLAGSLFVAFVIIRIAATTPLAYGTQTLHNKIAEFWRRAKSSSLNRY